MTESNPERFHFDFSGGHLALDFVNTISWRLTEATDRVPDFGSLVSWSVKAGALAGSRTTNFLVTNMKDPQRAAAVMEEARSLRETLYEIFSAVTNGRPAPQKAMGMLNSFLMQGGYFVRLVSDGKKFRWDWDQANPQLNAMLWPIARAAADLLVSEELRHVRMCDADDCAWLFMDRTRNHQRRWCDMTTCGNRVKARRHYQRLKRAAK